MTSKPHSESDFEIGMRKLRRYGGNAVLGEREANAVVDAYDGLEEQLEAMRHAAEYAHQESHSHAIGSMPDVCPPCATFAGAYPASVPENEA